MKLETTKSEINKSTTINTVKSSVKNTSMLFSMLRDTMYPNPIKALCREVMSNSRDAHREVGKPEVPIVIHLPNAFEPWWSAQDFGPGITPDRMDNVFMVYFESTKRNDDVQTGGFGLGAKSPWSYTDSFTVETITPEKHWTENGEQYENCLVKRVYIIYIDETEEGARDLVYEKITNEPQGTTIKVPVKPDDNHKFNEFTEYATRYWDVKPTIIGGALAYVVENFLIKSDTHKINPSRHTVGYTVVLDGIPYPLNIKMLSIQDEDIENLLKCSNGLLFFKTGELMVTPGREDLLYKTFTINAIMKLLEKIKTNALEESRKAIEGAPTYVDACKLYAENKGTLFDFVGEIDLFWNSRKVMKNMHMNEKDEIIFNKWNQSRTKIDSFNMQRIEEFYNQKYYWGIDGQRKETSRIRTLLDKGENPITIRFTTQNGSRRQELIKKYHLDMFTVTDLQTVPKTTASNGSYAKNSAIRKFTGNYGRKLSRCFENANSIPDGALYVILDRYDAYLDNGKSLNRWELGSISKIFNGVEIYGIRRAYLSKITNPITPLKDYILSEIMSIAVSGKVIRYDQSSRLDSLMSRTGKTLMERRYELKDQMGVASKYIKSSYMFFKKENEKFDDDTTLKNQKVETLSGFIGVEHKNKLKIVNKNLNTLSSKFYKTYPLLESISAHSVKIEDVINYINLIDSSLTK